MSESQDETHSSDLLKDGVFVKISFASMNEKSDKLPDAIRKKLSCLWVKKYKLYERCCIKTSLGYFCPNDNLAEVVEKSREFREEFNDIVANVATISKHKSKNPQIESFEFDIQTIDVVGKSYLEQHPEIVKSLDADSLREIEHNSQLREQQIRAEILADVKTKLVDFIHFLIESKKLSARGKVHQSVVSGIMKRLKRIEAMSKNDGELSMYVQLLSGFAKSIIEPSIGKQIVLSSGAVSVGDFSKICDDIAKKTDGNLSKAFSDLAKMM